MLLKVMQFNDDFWICLDVFSWMSFPWLFLEALPDEAGEAFFVGLGMMLRQPRLEMEKLWTTGTYILVSRVTLVVAFYITDSTQYLSILVGIIPVSHDEIVYEQTNLLHGAYQSDLRSDSSHLMLLHGRDLASPRDRFPVKLIGKILEPKSLIYLYYDLMRKVLLI